MVVKKYEGTNATIEIDEDKCIGSGEGKAHAIRINDCTECCLCVEACPTQAIKHSSC